MVKILFEAKLGGTGTHLRQPPAKLKGTVRTVGDIVSSLFSERKWDAMQERSARQLRGEPANIPVQK